MLPVSLEHPLIKASLLQLFAKRADRRTQQRVDFGLRLARPAQRPKQCACGQISSGKAVPRQKWRPPERGVEPVERQQKTPFSLSRILCVDVHELSHLAPNRCK